MKGASNIQIQTSTSPKLWIEMATKRQKRMMNTITIVGPSNSNIEVMIMALMMIKIIMHCKMNAFEAWGY
jgi:hypothetical protein